VAEHDLAGSDGLGGDAGIGLEADTEIGSSSSGAGPADDLVAGAQGDGSTGGAGEVLGTFGDGADGGLEIELGGMNFNFFAQGDGPKAGRGMCRIGYAQLTTQRQRRHAGVIGIFEDVRIGNGSQQISDEIVEFGVGNEMSGLLVA